MLWMMRVLQRLGRRESCTVEHDIQWRVSAGEGNPGIEVAKLFPKIKVASKPPIYPCCESYRALWKED
jgi:hypothetical protein